MALPNPFKARPISALEKGESYTLSAKTLN